MAKKRKMNKTELRQDIVDRSSAQIDDVWATLQELYEELEETRSNMEEKFSGTDRYQRLEELCQSMEGIVEHLSEAKSELDSVDCNYTS